MGDAQFVQSVLSEVDELEKENLRVRPAQMSLSSLAEKLCRIYQILLPEMRSGSRRREVVAARQELSQVAVTLLGYSGAEVARYLEEE